MANQTELREWSRYTYEQLVDYIVNLTNRIHDLEEACNKAYQKGYDQGEDDCLDSQDIGPSS